MQSFKKILFQWDKGNSRKSWLRHKVSKQETEEAFYSVNAKIFDDIKHSTAMEERFLLYSETKKGKQLYIVFTKRDREVRPISSRPMNRKEREIYEKTNSAA